MSTEALDCWDDYPMEHGCICGNDCAPPSLPLDPHPYVWSWHSPANRARTDTEMYRKGVNARMVELFSDYVFEPRPGYSQDREDYA